MFLKEDVGISRKLGLPKKTNFWIEKNEFV